MPFVGTHLASTMGLRAAMRNRFTALPAHGDSTRCCCVSASTAGAQGSTVTGTRATQVPHCPPRAAGHPEGASFKNNTEPKEKEAGMENEKAEQHTVVLQRAEITAPLPGSDHPAGRSRGHRGTSITAGTCCDTLLPPAMCHGPASAGSTSPALIHFS